MKTTTTWTGAHAFDAEKDGNRISVDGDGFNPKALLLTGLAACSAIDVVDILEKMRVPLASLAVDTEADQTDDHPRVFKTIHLTYRAGVAEEHRDKVKKAVELSLEKYCGVAAMLKKNSDIRYELVLTEPIS